MSEQKWSMPREKCPWCKRDYAVTVIGRHTVACVKNPKPRTNKQRRRTCQKCRRQIGLSGFTRHVMACNGIKKEPGVDPFSDTTKQYLDSLRNHKAKPVASTTDVDILVELLFPDGVPSNADFQRKFSDWRRDTEELLRWAS